jgi:dephospho-CoA kinase
MTYAIAVVGYPSSGKSVTKDVAKNLGYKSITMGDYVRQKTEENWGKQLAESRRDETDQIPSDVYGDFATEMREKHGQGVVAEWCKDEIIESESPVLIDGMRSPESKNIIEQYANLDILFIHAPASLRLEWIKNRGRDSENQFDAKSLLQRDMKENRWGVNELIASSDYTIQNCTTLEEYKKNVSRFLENRI